MKRKAESEEPGLETTQPRQEKRSYRQVQLSRYSDEWQVLASAVLRAQLTDDTLGIVLCYMTTIRGVEQPPVLRSMASGDLKTSMKQPSSFTVQGTEILCVSDTDDILVKVFDGRSGAFLRSFGDKPAAVGKRLYSLAVAGEKVYVGSATWVAVFASQDGQKLAQWSIEPRHVMDDICVSKDAIYALSAQKNALLRLSPENGQIVCKTEDIRLPRGHSLFYDEASNECIVSCLHDGTVKAISCCDMLERRNYHLMFPSRPHHAVVIGDQLLVADCFRGLIEVVDRQDRSSHKIARAAGSLAMGPTRLAVNHQQELLCWDSGSHCILVFR
jgi:hypothetical protein